MRHGIKNIRKKEIGYENGVLGGVVAATQAFCSPGDSNLLHAPAYIGFTMSLSNSGCHLVHSHLKQDEQGILLYKLLYRYSINKMKLKL